MTTSRSRTDRVRDPDDVLRDAIAVAVRRAPASRAWQDVEQRSIEAGGDESRSRWPLFVVAATVLALGVAGGLIALTRPGPQTVRTDDAVVTTAATTAAPTTNDAGSGAVAEGRSGGPLRDEGCDWALVPLSDQRGVSMRQVGMGGSSATDVYADGSDDVVWVNQAIFCADGPTVVFGGARGDVGRVVVQTPDGEQLELDLFEVPGETWRAVMGTLPRAWRIYSPLEMEVIAMSDESVLGREPYQS